MVTVFHGTVPSTRHMGSAGGPWGPITNVGNWVDQTLHLPLSSGHYVTINADYQTLCRFLFEVDAIVAPA
jgi:hypothetical protein